MTFTAIYEYKPHLFTLSILLLMDIWFVFDLGLFWIVLLWKFLYVYFGQHMHEFFVMYKVISCVYFLKKIQIWSLECSELSMVNAALWGPCLGDKSVYLHVPLILTFDIPARMYFTLNPILRNN